MRLDKFLSNLKYGSRNDIKKMCKDNLIKVNGDVVKKTDINIDPNLDSIEVDNQKVFYKENITLMINKPKGYICSAKDERGRKTIFELINVPARVFSVGRLDYNSEGLLLLTNDGDFANKIAHPSNHINKEYIVTIEGEVLESELAVLRAGVVENGKRMPSAKVKFIEFKDNVTRLSVIIDEGQNRQIRRMFEGIGRTIILLKRVSIGGLKLGGLTRGKLKELTEKELDILAGELN